MEKSNYAKTPAYRRIISATTRMGIPIAAVRLGPDGSIEIIVAGKVVGSDPANDFDRLEAEGQL
jgi:hypothetical protein